MTTTDLYDAKATPVAKAAPVTETEPDDETEIPLQKVHKSAAIGKSADEDLAPRQRDEERLQKGSA